MTTQLTQGLELKFSSYLSELQRVGVVIDVEVAGDEDDHTVVRRVGLAISLDDLTV